VRVGIGFVCVVVRLGLCSNALGRRARTAEVEPELAFTLALGGNLAIDLLSVIAALGNRLRAGLQPRFDLIDLGIGILQRIDPIPFGGQPVGTEVGPPLALVAR
jgi:hypothetical protein